jgi:fengycin family lipopeptide synthetase B
MVRNAMNDPNDTVLFPMSFAQKRLWFLNQLEPDTPFYNIPANIRMTGELDEDALQWAIDRIVKRHEILRTTFHMVDGEAVQEIHPHSHVPLPVKEPAKIRPEQLPAWIEQQIREEIRIPFDLSSGPLIRFQLIRISDQDHIVLTTMHHIVSDAWSMGIFIKEFTALYGEKSSATPANLPALQIQYADYSEWQNDWLAGETMTRQLDYWKKHLAGVPPLLDLPLDRPRPKTRHYESGSISFQASSDTVTRLTRLCRDSGTTLFMTLLGVMSVLLSKYARQDDIVVGSPVANRNQNEVESLIGFFVNTLVLRIDLTDNPSFSKVLKRVKQTALEAFDHQDIPFEKLVEAIAPERHLNISPLFQVSFAVQNAPVEDMQLAGLSVQPLTDVETGMGRFDLEFTFWEDEQLHGSIVYKKDIFDAPSVERMGQHFQTLLEAVLENPDAPIGDLTILGKAERDEMIALGSRNYRTLEEEPFLHLQFEAMAERYPEAIALTLGDAQMSYRELNEQANALAHRLITSGVMRESLVALYLERSMETVIGILGILKAGGAYLPLEPAYQNDRLTFMLADSGSRTIITMHAHVAQLNDFAEDWDGAVLYLDEDHPSAPVGNPDAAVTSQDLAYIIYTSGSTGRPKGVEITHHNVTRLFSTTREYFAFAQQDVWTLFHSHAFDMSVWEIWGALLHGSRLVIVPYWTSRNAADFHALLSRESVSVLSQTPSAFYPLIQVDEQASTVQKLSLRQVIFGGEALDIQKLLPWFERYGDSTPRLVNMYGITETTVHASYRPLAIADARHPQSMIGDPLPDLMFYLLDEHDQPVPYGVKGEIHVGGKGLARCYHNRPELTAARFIDDPFAVAGAGGRLYKSGDLARWLPDGDLEYCGRIDHQVQIRGFRVELGEIETLLSENSDISEAVVLYQEGQKGSDLTAYVVATQDDAEFPIAALRTYLGEKLPDYMIPGQIMIIDEIPLTAHGKIDRATLAGIRQDAPALSGGLPSSPTEITLAEIWAEVMDIEVIGVDDNFFELGGHSLLATQVVTRIEQAFAIELALREIFEKPTIARLAVAVEEQQLQLANEMDGESLANFLDEISELSDQEAKALLKK